MTTKEIKKQLSELEEYGEIDYDISYRGGHYGLKAEKVIELLGLDCNEDDLPPKLGAFVNYLGGGLRGTINISDYSENVGTRDRKKLDTFLEVCKERYKEIEDAIGLNIEEYEDGDVNWDATGTRKVREGGISSTY